MITHVQQILANGLMLLFGLLALQVWRRAGPVRRDPAALAWGVTAAYFIIVGGGYSTIHSVLSATVMALGKESALYQWWIPWIIPANLARGAASIVFALILLLLLVLRRRWVYRVAHAAPVVLIISAALLTVVARQIPLLNNLYWLGTGLAVLSTITAMLMMGVLLAAVLNDSIDQLLWIALALYALKETVSVSMFAIIAWWNLVSAPDAWRFFYWGSAALAAGMSALAIRRLRMAGEGRRVPALFERVYTLRRSHVS